MRSYETCPREEQTCGFPGHFYRRMLPAHLRTRFCIFCCRNLHRLSDDLIFFTEIRLRQTNNSRIFNYRNETPNSQIDHCLVVLIFSDKVSRDTLSSASIFLTLFMHEFTSFVKMFMQQATLVE